jgi:TPP-dependent pyruvate/acetoin dehydrogenase alpha subunit
VMNIAAKEKLPLVFALENNNLEAVSIHAGGFSAANTSVKDFAQIPRLFGIATQSFAPDRGLAEIFAGLQQAAAACRRGDGPQFVELMNVRWPGSNMIFSKLLTGITDIRMAWGDAPIAGEHANWIARHDPVLRMARDFVGDGILGKDDLLTLDRAIIDRIAAAARFAIDSPLPEPRSAANHVFA